MKTIFTRFLLAALGAAGLASCSLVDSPAESPKPITNVSEFYYQLNNIGSEYSYELRSADSRDTMKLTMGGSEAGMITLDRSRCYSAATTAAGDNFSIKNYYAMNDSTAYSLGRTNCGLPGRYWVDLKTPLTVGQTWEFDTQDPYTAIEYKALVARRGASMKMPDGKIYDDVAQIIYTSSSQDTIVKYFARGVGLVYSVSKSGASSETETVGLVGKQ